MNAVEPNKDHYESQSSGVRWIRWMVVLVVFVGCAWFIFGQGGDDNSNVGDVAAPETFDDSQVSEVTLDEALQIASSALDAMEQNLTDYQATLIKREEVDGELMPENEMFVKIRPHRDGNSDLGVEAQPLTVYLHFRRPDSVKGREVIFREGWNDGKLMVHETGFMNIMRLSLDPEGMLAMQGNRYPITKIGFKTLVRELISRGKQIKQVGKADVQLIDDYEVGGRKCLLIQVRPIFDSREGLPDDVQFSLAEIAMDHEWQVPLRYAAYGFPESPDEKPPLQEEYTYLDVVLNSGLADLEFDPDNPAYDFP